MGDAAGEKLGELGECSESLPGLRGELAGVCACVCARVCVSVCVCVNLWAQKTVHGFAHICTYSGYIKTY